MAEYNNGRNNGTRIVSDDEIIDQLRQYADALQARATNDPLEIPGHSDGSDPQRRTPMLAVAAAAFVLVAGAAAFLGLRNDVSSIQSTSDEQISTTTADPDRVDESTDEGADDQSTVDDAVATMALMPDPGRWVITEAYGPQTSPGYNAGGTWAWRLDGQVFVLIEPLGLDDLGPLDEASVEVSDGRVMIGWIDGDRRLGFQGYGIDEATLRTVAGALVQSDGGWTLPGAEVLVADSGGDTYPTESIQVGYSPVASAGTADLSKVVTSVRRQGTRADLYRELFEASSLGRVSETTVAGHAAYLIVGPFGSYGLALGDDGWVSSWQTMAPSIDLGELLGSVRPVAIQEWDEAVARSDDNVSQAVAAAIAGPEGGIDTADPAGDPQLPRYMLPEPWTFRWVTDMGLWSAEERAQREALNAAHASSGVSAELILTQGFVQPDPSAGIAGSVPFAVPELLVQVYLRNTEDPITPEGPGEYESLSFAGLDGYLQAIEMHDPMWATGARTEFEVVATQGPLVVFVEGPFVDEQTIRRFVADLSLRGGDLSEGVALATGEFEQLLELPGDQGNGAGMFGRWGAAYANPSFGSVGEQDRPHASLVVESMSFEQLQVEMMRSISRGVEFEPVAGGQYLANRFERQENLVFDDGVPVLVEDGEVIRGTTLLRYNAETQQLVTLSLDDELDAAITLLERLTEVDIETWRSEVEPYNSKPLEPR